MKSLIVFTLLIATAFAGSQVTDLMDKLDDLLIAAHSAKNVNAIDEVENAIDTVTFAAAQLKICSDDQVETFQAAIDDVESDLPVIEKLVNNPIKSRSWFTKTVKSIGSKVKGLVTSVANVFSDLQGKGLGGFAAIFQPYIDEISKNSSVKGLISGLKVVQQGIFSLNKMTNGAIGPLNSINDVLNNIDDAGDLFNSLGSANSTDAMADALFNTLTASKSTNLKKVEKGLDYVCNGLADAESVAAA